MPRSEIVSEIRTLQLMRRSLAKVLTWKRTDTGRALSFEELEHRDLLSGNSWQAEVPHHGAVDRNGLTSSAIADSVAGAGARITSAAQGGATRCDDRLRGTGTRLAPQPRNHRLASGPRLSGQHGRGRSVPPGLDLVPEHRELGSMYFVDEPWTSHGALLPERNKTQVPGPKLPSAGQFHAGDAGGRL